MDLDLIKERRKDIEDDAPCVGCGSTLASCKANRGKDPTAPPWFGCCARGTGMAPCHHVPSQAALRRLLSEIETGEVLSVEGVLLKSIPEHGVRRQSRPPRDGLLDGVYLADYYAREEF